MVAHYFASLPDTSYSYKLVAIKLVTASKEHLEKHYADLAGKPFFPGLIACMCPVNCLVCHYTH